VDTPDRSRASRPNCGLIASAAVMIAWTATNPGAVAYTLVGALAAWVIGDAFALMLTRWPTVTLTTWRPWRAVRPRPLRRP
jgi:hypothetical protein